MNTNMVGKYRIRQTTNDFLWVDIILLFLAGLILARFISWAELVIMSILIIATFILLLKSIGNVIGSHKLIVCFIDRAI